MVEVAQVTSDGGIEAVRELMREYTAWAFSLTPESSDAPTFQGLADELNTLPGVYSPPDGRLLIATNDGQPAGCICLKPADSTTCELKRLYVRPAFRGLGIGRRMVEMLLHEARQIGYQRIELNTHITMTGAHAIYRAVGFRLTSTPSDFPEQLKSVAVFMELDLCSD